jgi:hypothetical protein
MATSRGKLWQWVEKALDVKRGRDREVDEVLPRCLLVGMRSALDSGLSIEQIASILIMAGGVYEASVELDQESFTERTIQLLRVMERTK